MKLARMSIRTWLIVGLLSTFALLGRAAAQRGQSPEPTAILNFIVIKEDNGKPVRSAAVIMHPVSASGKLRVQVLASGFQTFGEDFDIDKAKMDFTIKLKRPQGQYSIYQDHHEEKKDDKKDDKTPPPDPNAKPQ